MSIAPNLPDRIAARRRPDGLPLMYQNWGSLLFIHWAVPVASLRPVIPARLEVDTFDGMAWLAITPFTVWNVRPPFLPPMPWLSSFHEINVRTYVHLNGLPGVWFFSLDANRLLPVLGARAFYHLPYRQAEITLERTPPITDYRVKRTTHPEAVFHARWSETGDDFKAAPGTLEFFLTERYMLFTEHKRTLFQCRIHHEAWPLREARLETLETSLLDANGLPEPADEPIVVAGGPVHVEVWPLKAVK
jgi:uncharacterized protein YqjF (DUF2071 family)